MFGEVNKARLKIMLGLLVVLATATYMKFDRLEKEETAIHTEMIKEVQEKIKDYQVINKDLGIYSNANLSYTEIISVQEQIAGYQFPGYEKDYIVIITDEEFELSYYAKQIDEENDDKGIITGKTYRTSKEIYVHKDYIGHALLHEIGHAVDFTHDYTNDHSFIKIYEKIEHDDYYSGSIREYFAEGYSRFLKGELNENIREDAKLIRYFERILKVEY